MLLKYFYDPALAHASYMIGCQKTGEAIIIDPGRDIETYLVAAAREKMKIVGAAETHIHADYVSGMRELAERTGAKLYLSDEGPPDWKYLYAKSYSHQLLKDGDTFSVGNIHFQTLHTPGHTPESISFLLTDKGGGANEPMGIFTGDFVFVGSIGRPDLLEVAAGISGTAESGARQLFQSIRRFRELPDYLQLWPAHGAGSACGKGLGAIPSSTTGYEKRFNPALQFSDEHAFVEYILAEQPEPPKYFAIMKRVNKEGPSLLKDTGLPEKCPLDQLLNFAKQETVIDTAPPAIFGASHVPGTISIPSSMLASWAGSILDYNKLVYLITSKNELAEATRILRKIGCDNIAGFFDSHEVAASGLRTETIRQIKPTELADGLKKGKYELIDVRGSSERHEKFIENSQYRFLGNFGDVNLRFYAPEGKTIAFHCKGGGRSTIACSIAKRLGFDNVVNVTGGIDAWVSDGLPVLRNEGA